MINIQKKNREKKSKSTIKSQNYNEIKDEYDDIIIINNDPINPRSDSISMEHNFTLEIIGSFFLNSFEEEFHKANVMVDQAKAKISNGLVLFNSNDVPIEPILDGFYNTFKDLTSNMMTSLKTIPAFAQLDYSDFSTIIKNKFLNYSLILYSGTKINNENYFILNNGLQLTRLVMEKIIGVELCDINFEISKHFHSLEMNQREFSAFLAFIVSYPQYFFKIKETNKIVEFHQLAAKVLAHELFLSKRSILFAQNLTNVRWLLSFIMELKILKNF